MSWTREEIDVAVGIALSRSRRYAAEGQQDRVDAQRGWVDRLLDLRLALDVVEPPARGDGPGA